MMVNDTAVYPETQSPAGIIPPPQQQTTSALSSRKAASQRNTTPKRSIQLDPAAKQAIELQRALTKAEKRRRRRATVKYRTLHASRERYVKDKHFQSMEQNPRGSIQQRLRTSTPTIAHVAAGKKIEQDRNTPAVHCVCGISRRSTTTIRYSRLAHPHILQSHARFVNLNHTYLQSH
jgi:hypothetical protein